MKIRIAAASVLAGAALTVAILFLSGWRPVPVNGYEIRVLFPPDATAAQQDTVRGLLRQVPADGGAPVLTTPEQTWAALQKTYTDLGEPIPLGMTAENVTAMLVISVTGRDDFDCGTLDPVQKAPGVFTVRIVVSGEPDGTLTC